MIAACGKDFALDRGVSYLNAAYMSPMPRVAVEAGLAGVVEKGRPWTRDRAAAEAKVEECRAMAAGLVGAEADDMAVVGSVSYGIAVACANLPVAPGHRLIALEDEHHSIVLSLRALAERTGAVVDAIPRPDDGDWTAAVLERLEADAAPVALAALTPVHWMDGTLIDLARLAPRLRGRGARLIVDATQSAGVLPLDARGLQADFVVFPTYKWLLGPYGVAFLYVAAEHQAGRPLEEHAFNHRGPIEPLPPAAASPPYQPGARRFDRGEIESYVTMPAAHAALSYLSGFGPEARLARISELTDALRTGMGGLNVSLAPPELSSPHILCFRPPRGREARLAEAMAAAGVAVTHRYGLCRVSPHIYNDHDDVRTALDAMAAAWGRDVRADGIA